MSPPSTNGSNGRTAAGRFAPGWQGGPGNPFARRVGELRRVLLEAVTPDDLTELARALLDKAKAGDVAACKLLLSYLVGQPMTPVAVEVNAPVNTAEAIRQVRAIYGLDDVEGAKEP